MEKIRVFLLNLPTIKAIIQAIGLKKTYIYHMKEQEDHWNPYLSNLVKFAFAQSKTLSEFLVTVDKAFYVQLPLDDKYTQIIPYEKLKLYKDIIYSDVYIRKTFKHLLKVNHIDKKLLESGESGMYSHFFSNFRTNIFTRTIEDICKIAHVTPYEFIRTVEAIAYMDILENESA